MNLLHIGPKNYPPAHGGVEKSVYDLIRLLPEFNSSIFVEWNQKETENIKVLPKGIIKQIKEIKHFSIKKGINIIHFNKETFIPHAIYTSFFLEKTVITIHGCACRIKRWAWYYRLTFYILDILACIFVPKVVFVGKEDYRHFSRLIFWRKLNFNPNGIEKNNFTASKDIKKCVFIGRISPEKNVLRLINMFRNSKYELTIYGAFDKYDPTFKQKVLQEISTQANIKYGGVIDYTDIIPTLSKFNTFYNISFSEGMPVSVLEAASVGLNLVLSNIPQHSDLKFPDAFYVNPYNPVLTSEFSGYSQKNKEHVETNYSLQQTVDNYRKIYQQLTSK